MNDNENLILRLEIIADELKDIKRLPMEATVREAIVVLKKDSSERSVQPVVMPGNIESFAEYCDKNYGLFIPSWMIDRYNKNRNE